MTTHEESLQLRVLPPDFDGPICVECKFASNHFHCHAIVPKEIRPAQRDPITGEVSPALLCWPECRKQNANGDCKLFERKSEEVSIRRATPPSFWRQLAGEIGAALLRWAKER